MPKLLDAAAIKQYREEGYYFPLPVLSDEEIAWNRTQLEEFEAVQGHPLQGPQRSKSHLLFKWVDDLMRHAKILDAVEDLIGPDILCWNTLFWIKESGSESFVSWHQDLNYWGLDNSELVTVWLALSPASLESGCMRVLPRSHFEELMPHQDRYDDANMLTRGQEVAVNVDETKAVAMPLKAGEVSLHNVRVAHASGPNLSADRRIGLSLHYIPTKTKQKVGGWDSAALVRGEDRFGNFNIAPQPARDMDPDSVAFHARATDELRKILFADAEKVRPTL